MNKFFAKMRYNKQLLIAFIFLVVNIIFVVGVVIFDIVQIALVIKNTTNLTRLFIPLNIAFIAIISFDFLIVLTMFIIRIIKVKKNELKKD